MGEAEQISVVVYSAAPVNEPTEPCVGTGDELWLLSDLTLMLA